MICKKSDSSTTPEGASEPYLATGPAHLAPFTSVQQKMRVPSQLDLPAYLVNILLMRISILFGVPKLVAISGK